MKEWALNTGKLPLRVLLGTACSSNDHPTMIISVYHGHEANKQTFHGIFFYSLCLHYKDIHHCARILAEKKPRFSQYILLLITVFLAHLSRRLTGELIVYTGIRRPSVRSPSVVRPSTFSNDISSEAMRRILSIFHI